MALEWHGDKIIAKVKQAERTGVQVTMGVAVKKAKVRVRKDTTRLMRSIEVQSIKQDARGTTGVWGSDDPKVPYAIHQEFGPAPGSKRKWAFTPYLRPSAAEEYPKLASRIAAVYQGRPIPP